MNRTTVTKAIEEARRFIERAEALLDADAEHWDPKTQTRQPSKWRFPFDAPKQSGACRRASMDLTRALAEMRRP